MSNAHALNKVPDGTSQINREDMSLNQRAALDNSMLEAAPINIMHANLDGIITYLNPASETTLRRIEHLLPVKVDDIVGGSYDVFHGNPAHNRDILRSERNLPHRARITVGNEILDLLVSATFDEEHNYQGPMVTWEIITEKVAIERRAALMASMVENASVNILYCDRDFILREMNQASKNTLQKLSAHLPDKVENLIGQPIDIFHKAPEKQRQLLGNERNLPHEAEIRLGPEYLSLRVSACLDHEGTYIGPMVTWEVITEKKNLVNSLGEAATALAASSEELTATAGEMSSNAKATKEQADDASSAASEIESGVQQLAASAEELSASIREISESMNQTTQMVDKTITEARESNQIMSKLADSSQEIGDVIKAINSIAQQTNLLALNATIEAARAGDAGRGFAVVAKEVKELANQTAAATDEITRKINAIQSDTTLSVNALKNIGVAIENVNGFATQVSAAVEEQSATNRELSKIATEAASGIARASQNIQTVSSNAEQTSSGAEQLVVAAKNLNDLAAQLSGLVEKVKSI